MQELKDKKAIMADAYSDKRVKELTMATATPYQMKMASMEKSSGKGKALNALKGSVKEGVMEGVKARLKPINSMKLEIMKKKSPKHSMK
jgi:hypothetical protein